MQSLGCVEENVVKVLFFHLHPRKPLSLRVLTTLGEGGEGVLLPLFYICLFSLLLFFFPLKGRELLHNLHQNPQSLCCEWLAW